MIVGLGLDVVELPRIASALARFGDRFVARILTPAERAALPARPLSRVAGLFAAKEAAAKALGTGFAQGIGFQHLEILSDHLGRPTLGLHGPALERARALGATSWHVSISHEHGTAAAVVVLELASGCGRWKKRAAKEAEGIKTKNERPGV
ncbi:MAG: holo-[acyl-carrier-protein] synthase [Solidesulfovibrio sp.]|uniref:holo-[acyl-carrier-protein] synthase n=1 Tax=Solidesulfovibrio sp. TaxID=2910990 RepID=UPI002B1F436C|nr:holo-[acyl-carrier-protein] synthase [Solidesulfovibrio sp.]MEA4856544.1 holo-[acyl-carrier-protein] synthase [Solidesulfovibrio sp.]